MGAKSPTSGHELTREDNSRGGKNSKRGPSITTVWERLLSGKVPPILKKALDHHKENINGELVNVPIKLMSSNLGESFAMLTLKQAFEGDRPTQRLIQQALDGLPGNKVQEIKIIGDDNTAAEFNAFAKKAIS